MYGAIVIRTKEKRPEALATRRYSEIARVKMKGLATQILYRIFYNETSHKGA
jgi:hypothetical protein